MSESVSIPGPDTTAAIILMAAPSGTFTLEKLVVCAWELYPEALGLRGFEGRHPSENRVLAAVYGRKGLADLGYLRRVSPKGSRERVYELTPLGLECVQMMQRGEMPKITPKGYAAILDAANGKHAWEQTFIQELSRSAAAMVPRAEITFPMATSFFNGTDRGKTMHRLAEIGESDDANLARDARILRALGEHLEEKFARHWRIMDERNKVKA